MQAERGVRENVARPLPEDTLWVRFVFVDHAGIPKCKAVHRDGFAGRARAGVGLAKGVLALDPSGALHPESGLSPVGECRLVPDLSTLTALPFVRGQAMVSCDMTEPDARTPWEGCPRSALKRVLGRLAERGYSSLASYETEFYVWGPDGPLDRTPYAGSFALTSAADFVAELAQTLEEMGIRPEQCHAEVGHGNLELSVGEDEALRAADKRVMVLEAIRGVAHRMGLQTTMAPKPYLEGAGNGHHLHVSLYEGDAPVLFDTSGALSGPGSGFVAGILDHMPAIMAFTAASPNSYQRLAPGMWSSAYAAYGLDNREAAVRLASPVVGRESATANVEIKPVDVTSNPYLALAAVLAAGMDGIERGLDPGEPTMVDPATLDDEERASRGIRPLPASLDEALDALEEDRVLNEAFGEPLMRTHVAVARAQSAIAREISPEEVSATASTLY
ncbi:MAG TPA: glutamine synthetase family protein [Rubrobacter sp.]|nr:glutamine synthetase family protein [Rubrobacter sp.]